MKHLSMLLTVLMLGSVPLAAAALDYGPNQPLLAAENGAPQAPGMHAHVASTRATPKLYAAETGDDEASDASPEAPRTATAASSLIVQRSGHGPSASNRPQSTVAKPATAPSPASWQSLLPGSIQ